MKKLSVNKRIRKEALKRLKLMGYTPSQSQAILRKSFKELREKWLELYKAEQ
jgi:hypothetical protein